MHAIPFCTPNSTIIKSSKNTSSLLYSSTIPIRKLIKSLVYGKPDLISLVSQLLVRNQSNIPPEIPDKEPPEFPRRSNNDDLPSVPLEVPELPRSPKIETSPPDEGYIKPPRIPEVPNPGPGFPVLPLPYPRLPPKFPLDPDIIPPPAPPPPDIEPTPDTPDIKPSVPGLHVV